MIDMKAEAHRPHQSSRGQGVLPQHQALAAEVGGASGATAAGSASGGPKG